MSFAGISAAVGIIGTGIAAGTKKNPKSTTQLEFPEETRRLIGDVEFPLLEGFQGEQAGFLGPLLGDRSTFAPFLGAQFGGTVGPITQAAARRGAQDAGVTDLGPMFESLYGLSPELLQSLRELALQRGAQVKSVVPPGFGTFLSPSTSTTTSGTGPSAFETGFGLAGALTPIVGSFF